MTEYKPGDVVRYQGETYVVGYTPKIYREENEFELRGQECCIKHHALTLVATAEQVESVAKLEEKLTAANATIEKLRRVVKVMRRCIHFFKSVIKSGEPWSFECSAAMDDIDAAEAAKEQK